MDTLSKPSVGGTVATPAARAGRREWIALSVLMLAPVIVTVASTRSDAPAD
jgi:hypothetical protein